MKLSQARINFRTRTGWEAIDLGFRLAALYRLKLAALWLLVSLPWFFLSILLFWNHPDWIIIFIWWLKPVFEGSTLNVISIAVFQDPPPFKECLKEAYRQMINPRLVGDLTWRRFSPCRSLFLPVKQLEQLKGSDYRKRKKILASQASGSASVLTLVGSNIEFILYGGLWAILLWLFTYTGDFGFGNHYFSDVPEMVYNYFFGEDGVGISTSQHYLSAFFYLLTLSFWGPIYVSCGFTLYLNARSALEAWDIELTFRRLVARLSSVFLLVMCVSLFLGNSESSFAEGVPNKTQVEAQRDTIINHKPYPYLKTKTEYCYKSCDKKEMTQQGKDKQPTLDMSNSGGAGSLFTILMWSILVALAGLVIWYFLRDPTWIAALIDHKKKTPKILFGMEVTPESLPDDVGQAALKNYDSDPRVALGLLYRASLTQLIHQYDTPLRNGHTESEVLDLAKEYALPAHPYLALLTNHWINLAYGHKNPPANLKETLCLGYNQTFPKTPKVSHESTIKVKGDKHA